MDGEHGKLLGARIREARRGRGLTREALAKRAGVSRTTLHHLEAGRTTRPRADTLGRIAAALELASAELHALSDAVSEGVATEDPDAAGAFDRATNTAIHHVHEESPELFAGWEREDWDALYSTFGTGGELTAEGTRREAERINRQRETVDRLRIVLETHLADVAERMIGTLYEMVAVSTGTANVQVRSGSGPGDIGPV